MSQFCCMYSKAYLYLIILKEVRNIVGSVPVPVPGRYLRYGYGSPAWRETAPVPDASH